MTEKQRRQSGRQRRPVPSPPRALLLVLLSVARPSASQTWETSNDPDGLCSPSVTGYRATRDCRGYAYCNDGYLMGGGVISCWPNQLFDQASGVCTYWQQVDTSECPDFDGGMMMPAQEDKNANEERFFCGVSASNAKRVCEPCPGGSRLECSDPAHNCFAGITGCKSSGGGGKGSPNNAAATSNAAAQASSTIVSGNLANAPDPTPQPAEQMQFAVMNAPSVDNNANDGNGNNGADNNGASHPTSSDFSNDTYLHGVLRSSYFCGWSWDTAIQGCRAARPCPTGLNNECPVGQTCFPDTPCGQALASTSKPTPRPVSQEERGYYCGYDWDWVVSNCARSTPCPHGDASGVCPSGMRCIAGTPCWAINNGMPTPKPTPMPTQVSFPPVKGDDPGLRYCGYDWDWVVHNCMRTTPCPTGDTRDCPSGMKCIADTPCRAINNGMPTPKPTPLPTKKSYPPVQGDDPDKRFCGYDWADVTANCLTAVPCPTGVAQGVCPDNMNCIAETQCADETYLAWLREKQANNGSGKPLAQEKPVVQAKPGPAVPEAARPSPPTLPVAIPAPTPLTATANLSNSEGGRCSSNGDCQTGQFCHQPNPSAAGHCGACLPSNGAGCSIEQICRTPGCHGGRDEPGVAKCFERWDPWELNKDCEMRLNDMEAKCDVDTMLCRSGQSESPAQQNDAGSGSDAGVSAPMYENEEGNTFFCGETYAGITENCLRRKPCPGGRAENYCEDHEGCFRAPSCEEEYAAAANGVPNPSNEQSTPATHIPIKNPINTEPPKQSTTPMPSQGPTINTRYCGVTWADHAKDCANSLPCPRGDECPDGESCFTGSPCARLANGPGNVNSNIGNYCGTTWNKLNLMCESATKCTPGGNECAEGEFCYQDFTCDPPPTTTAPIMASPAAGLPTSNSPSLAPTTPVPSKAPTINTNFCGVSWADHAKDCANSLPCPRGDECPDGESCFRGSPCAMLANGPGNSDPKVGNFCGTTWNELSLMCTLATECTPGGNECSEGEFCYQDFTCDPPPTTTAPIMASPAAGLPTSNSPSLAPTTPVPSKAPTINTNFCGVSWADHAKDCENSLPCPRGDECPAGKSCFRGSPCAVLANGPGNSDPKVGNFCGTTWNELSLMCTLATKCTPGGNECAKGEFCYQDFTCDPPPTTTPTITTSPTNSPIAGAPALSTLLLSKAPTTSTPSKSPTINTNFCGVSWADHAKDCENSLPCPRGDECPDGESCFQRSPCEKNFALANGPGNGKSNVGNFCGTTWNELNLMCKSAMKCTPGGNECGEGEFCYQDFTCDPPPTTTPTITMSPTGSPIVATAPALASLLIPKSKAPTTSMPSKSPTINTNFCGVSWADHAKDCSNSVPCPRGDECAPGESCFQGSPCASTAANNPENANFLDSNVGNFCGKTWNELNMMCKSATRCTRGGNECAEGEFCYQDFTCDPPPITEKDTLMGSDGSLTWDSAQGTNQNQPVGDSCSLCGNSQVDWSSGVNFEFTGESEWNTDISCGEFEWIFRAENVLEGSTQCLDFRAEYFGRCCYAKPVQTGCNLCDAGMGKPWHDMRDTVNVMFEGFETSCADLSNKVRTRFDPSSDECSATKEAHFETCCFERCSLCGDANLDWEANVIFSGKEVLCHELDQTIFPENHVAEGSSRCLVSQGFYADSCCITPPVEPCNLCSSNGIHFNMKSNEKVSYKGELQSCLEVYHSLISRREQHGTECIDAQEEVFDQCCEALSGKTIPGDTNGGGADETSSPPNMFPTKKPTADFESWYTGSFESSASSLMLSAASLCLSIAMGLLLC